VHTAVSNETGAKKRCMRRNQLVSRGAKRTWLWFVTVVLAAAITLRIEAAIYARRIVSAVSALSTLRLGETSQADTLRRIPSLRPYNLGHYADCDADECFYAIIENGLPGRLLYRSYRTESIALSDVIRWWGFRAENLEVTVSFTSGKVSSFRYRLMVSAPGVPAGVPPPPADGKLGAVIIGLSSKKTITSRVSYSTTETHPLYRVTPARNAPSQSIGIELTPGVSDEIARRAFDLRLNCIWTLAGCRRWSQLLPSVESLTQS
jgi:hypothetical protein